MRGIHEWDDRKAVIAYRDGRLHGFEVQDISTPRPERKEIDVIYEIRTYNLKTRQLQEYWKRFAEKLPGREAFSKLGGHWYSEIGPLNQMVAIWPYEDLHQRADIRKRAEAGPNPAWPPDSGELIVDMMSQIYLPAPFMRPLSSGKLGPLYEMRLYTYPAEAISTVLEVWGDHIEVREELSPLVGCWYAEYGGHNNFIHLWAYESFEDRMRIRQEARDRDIWPPPSPVMPVRQESKLLFPAPFSPLQ